MDRGLAYLARAQERRGSWSNRRRARRYPVAMTALAGIAFLMDGNTTTQGRYAPQVDRAANFLLRSVDPNRFDHQRRGGRPPDVRTTGSPCCS